MKKSKVYRSLGSLFLAKGIIGCIINALSILLVNVFLILVFAIFNISFIIMGINMRKTALSEVELDKKTGAVTTMIMLAVAINITLAFFGFELSEMIYVITTGILLIFGLWNVDITLLAIFLLVVDIFLAIAILVSCISYHKQINSKKQKRSSRSKTYYLV